MQDASNEMILDQDTLDLIKTSDKKSQFGKEFKKNKFFEEEKQLDGVEDEWEKFLSEAKHETADTLEYKDFETKNNEDDEKLRVQYYRNLVHKDILQITEKKQDGEAPAIYAQSVIENRMINEKDIDKTNFGKEINDILNIEIILLVLSRTSLHLSISSDLEITRWKKFLTKFLKKNSINHEGLFGLSQINFSIGLHELAVDYCTKAIEYSKSKIPQYLIWRSLYLYFIYLNFKADNHKDANVAKYYLSCESCSLEAEKVNPDNYAIQYLLLILSCEKLAMQRYHKSLVNSVLKNPASYASKIMKLNKYMGYI